MKVVKKIANFLLIFLTGVIFFAVNWGLDHFDSLSFDEALYNINPTIVDSSSVVLWNYFIHGLLPAILFTIVVIILLIFLRKKSSNYALDVKVKIFKKIKKWVFVNDELVAVVNGLMVFLMFLILIFSLNRIGLFAYIKANLTKSSFIENIYVDPKKVNLTFPEKKRNLIYIFVESLESSYFNPDFMVAHEGGIMKNIKELTDNNIYFSSTGGYGGAVQVSDLGWTTAGMIAQTAGIPTKIPGSIANETNLKSIIPGAYSIGNILEKEGYNQLLMFGSVASFGNRGVYFKTHGNYKIFDYNYALENKKIPIDYYNWWGFEDSKLFEYAKEEVLELAKDDNPFNLTLLTANTHFPEGLVEENCKNEFTVSYSNAISCSLGQIADFISWIQEQDFYDDTTIVIAGDHLTMQAGYFYPDSTSNDRTVYNLFINSAISENNSRNRLFTTMDLYPTTLAAMGVKIDGDKLALGVNLFSSEQTIIEKYGKEYVDDEITKVSKFYKSEILK